MKNSVVLFSVKGAGIQTYTLQLANALAPFARVAYAIDIHDYETKYDAIDPRITLLKYRHPRLREIWGIAEFHRLAKEITKFQPNIFHLQGDGAWESLLLRFLPDIRVVNTIHDPIKHIDQRTYLNNWTMKDTVKRASGWVLHSEGLKKIFIESNRKRVNERRILIHPHGIYDYYCRYAMPSDNREKYILFFGKPRVNKGLDILLEAIDRINDRIPDWKIIMAGSGYDNHIQNTPLLKNSDRFIVHNRYIPDAEAADLFARSGMIVLPYRHGSQSGVLAMAAAFSCPVLATRVGNIPEILTDNIHALLFEPENTEELSRKLVDLATNKGLRTRLGKNLNNFAKSEWSWGQISENTLQFYQKVIDDQVSY